MKGKCKMYCYFMIGGKKRFCLYSQVDGMTVYDENRNKLGVYQPVMKDNRPVSFTVDGEKIMFSDVMASTPEELVQHLYNRTRFFNYSALCCTLMKYGIDCLTLKINEDALKELRERGSVAISRDPKPDSEWWIKYKFLEKDIQYYPESCNQLQVMPRDEFDAMEYPVKTYYVTDLIHKLETQRGMYQLEAHTA